MLLTGRRPALRVDLDVLPSPVSPLEHSWYTTTPHRTKRPHTAPQSGMRSFSPSFHDRIKDIHDQLPSIAQDLEGHGDPSDRITWIFDRRPIESPPKTLPTNQTGFLNRSPKIMQTGSNTYPPIPFPLRRPNVPPLYSYKEPSIAPSRKPSAGGVAHSPPHTSQSAKPGLDVEVMQRRVSHRMQDAPHFLLRKRPSTAPSDELDRPKRRHRKDGFWDLNREERQAVIPPFSNAESVSQLSLCTPVTTSTLPSDSMSSLPTHDYTFDESSPSPPKKIRSLWKPSNLLRTKTESPTVTDDVSAPPPAPRHLRTMVSSPHLGISTSPLKVELRVVDGMRGRDGGGKERREGGATLKKDSTVKRIWKSLVGRGRR